ncbi:MULTISPECIES: hypothetical protein [Acidiplasma]|jgi:hypothetical protein|uniref:Uncharacterized protein n=2 Tax=Acidiplasma TaxID=507753 RepID=A0A0Q0RLL9_9ARCH|nr:MULTISPECIES: hypothetical protein [Acidiplasma]KJE49217.1 hypothetical protein TZ01_03855 [Acidiplasma sp. MBA-1]KPV43140.1 hypothetical protein SE19_09085 [Acidiplasma aeolicum]KQB36395.1 hypothetical protein AOG54_07510 [Acidiplasma aeolicum]KQB36480.1 hypothetical protein AOG55_03905 [Acidiplasma cupricumulans]WMT54824.1 MAG: hypothetical protein RE470_07900 [Acidiplasma sp.]
MLVYYLINTVSAMLGRLDEIVIGVSALIISILWIPIALSFFSTDDAKRTVAKEKLKNALIGTFIYILAVSGAMYSIFNYIITGHI